MRIADSFGQALLSLRAYKLRSFLILLGIASCVCSIIVISSIGGAASLFTNTQFENMGLNKFRIQQRGMLEQNVLTLEDIQDIQDNITGIKSVYGFMEKRGLVKAQNLFENALIRGVSEEYSTFSNISIESGRFISAMDVSVGATVAVVDSDFAKKNFNTTDVLGRFIVLKNDMGVLLRVRIVGIIEPTGNYIRQSESESIIETIYIPVNTMQKFHNTRNLDSIEISVNDFDNIESIALRTIKLLEFKHSATDAYIASRVQENTILFHESSRIYKIIGYFVVAIMLLLIVSIVLKLGLNIKMLRKREIDVLRDVGAPNKDIFIQLWIEFTLISIAGIIIGLIFAFYINNIFTFATGIDVYLSYKTVLITSVGTLITVGIFALYLVRNKLNQNSN